MNVCRGIPGFAFFSLSLFLLRCVSFRIVHTHVVTYRFFLRFYASLGYVKYTMFTSERGNNKLGILSDAQNVCTR